MSMTTQQMIEALRARAVDDQFLGEVADRLEDYQHHLALAAEAIKEALAGIDQLDRRGREVPGQAGQNTGQGPVETRRTPGAPMKAVVPQRSGYPGRSHGNAQRRSAGRAGGRRLVRRHRRPTPIRGARA